MSIKGRNPVANLQKNMVYITNVDLVNHNEYTKGLESISHCFGLIFLRNFIESYFFLFVLTYTARHTVFLEKTLERLLAHVSLL